MTFEKRTVDRIARRGRLHTGPRVDAMARFVAPDAPERTDPCLALARDRSWAPGSDRHPPEGIETVTPGADGVGSAAPHHADLQGAPVEIEPGSTLDSLIATGVTGGTRIPRSARRASGRRTRTWRPGARS